MRANALFALALVASLVSVGLLPTPAYAPASKAIPDAKLDEILGREGKPPAIRPHDARKGLEDLVRQFDAQQSAIEDAKLLTPFVTEKTVNEIVDELNSQGKSVTEEKARQIVSGKILDAAKEAGVSFEILGGKLKVNASRTLGGVEIKGGEIDLYAFVRQLLMACLLAEAVTRGEACLKMIFGLGDKSGG